MTLWSNGRAETGVITRLTRREFLSVCGSGVAGAGLSAAAVAVACGGDGVSAPMSPTGTVRGTVTDLQGTPQSIGRIYLLLPSGLNQNIFADVSSSGAFDLG